MNIDRIALVAAAALALTACGKSQSGDAAAGASSAAATEAAPATSAPASAVAAVAGAVPTKDMMVGKWAEEGTCADLAIEFKADGSMVGPFERWELDNGVLTMVGNPSKMHLTVIDQDTMESRLDGSDAPRKLVRCK